MELHLWVLFLWKDGHLLKRNFQIYSLPGFPKNSGRNSYTLRLKRVRFTSIFTTAEIPASTIKIKDLCTRCLLCAKNCPVSAIPLKGGFPPPMDKKLCAIRSKQLRDEYRSPCGICIKVCPVGEDRELFGCKNVSIYSKDKKFEKYHKAWEHVRRYESKS